MSSLPDPKIFAKKSANLRAMVQLDDCTLFVDRYEAPYVLIDTNSSVLPWCMPRDRLTPLGRQLHTVLASLRSPVKKGRQVSHLTSPNYFTRSELIPTIPPVSPLSQHVHHSIHTFTAQTSSATAGEENVDQVSETLLKIADEEAPRCHSLRKSNRTVRTGGVTLTLETDGGPSLIGRRVDGKTEKIFHSRIRKIRGNRQNPVRDAHHILDDDDETHYTTRPHRDKLQRILMRYIDRTRGSTDESPYRHASGLTISELEGVESRGFRESDVSAWADIALAENSLDAARLIVQRNDNHDTSRVPIFVCNMVLRRKYISARALRMILQHLNTHVDSTQATTVGTNSSVLSVFLAVVGLLRHARKVWPQAFSAIVDLLIRHLEAVRQSSRPKFFHRQKSVLSGITLRLNRAMSLISLSTAVSPFKYLPYQEKAMSRILQFMSDHDPPLHPNREGYRAVIRLQLSQRKTPDEQLWAELKALSWPPWKVSRTGMDDFIGPEQGISRAHQTLRQMQIAGYAHLRWEKAVRIYAGWDTDRTPTIQTRIRVPRDVPKLASSLDWVARIETTRTVQEAWACFLAWEDLKLPANENVLLSVFKKLHQEERRIRKDTEAGNDAVVIDSWPILPGDVRETAPLPSSTHLHTYTRTAPPSVDDFYNYLHSRGIPFRNHLLAYVVANATSFRIGLRRLQDGAQHCPEIRDLMSFEYSSNLSVIPKEVFTAAVKLFCRFARVVKWGSHSASNTEHQRQMLSERPLIWSESDDGRLDLNRRHLAVHAVQLLKARRTTFRPAWNAALEGLVREANYGNLHGAIHNPSHTFNIGCSKNMPLKRERLDVYGGALIAYRLIRQVLTIYHELHLDLDADGFHFLCNATENLIVACWAILQSTPDLPPINEKSPSFQHRSHAKFLLRRRSHEERLKGEFRVLIGDHCPSEHEKTSEECFADGSLEERARARIPQLLFVPHPALLHAYVRSLGWLADYAGLYQLVQWMERHKGELSDRARFDRSGEDMMRRTLIALRVFMERSWLQYSDGSQTSSHVVETEADASAVDAEQGGTTLKRLRTSAEPALIQDVKHLIETVDGWGGWPTEQEVADYCQDARFSNVK